MLVCVLFAASAWAQSKGNARVNGKILDDQGKPASAVLVRAIKVGEPTPVEVKTNDKGEWKLEGLATGNWNFEFLKEGFEPQRMTLELENRNPPIDMKLTKAAAIDPNAELQAGMAKAVELQKAGKNAEARKIIEDLDRQVSGGLSAERVRRLDLRGREELRQGDRAREDRRRQGTGRHRDEDVT